FPDPIIVAVYVERKEIHVARDPTSGYELIHVFGCDPGAFEFWGNERCILMLSEKFGPTTRVVGISIEQQSSKSLIYDQVCGHARNAVSGTDFNNDFVCEAYGGKDVNELTIFLELGMYSESKIS